MLEEDTVRLKEIGKLSTHAVRHERRAAKRRERLRGPRLRLLLVRGAILLLTTRHADCFHTRRYVKRVVLQQPLQQTVRVLAVAIVASEGLKQRASEEEEEEAY